MRLLLLVFIIVILQYCISSLVESYSEPRTGDIKIALVSTVKDPHKLADWICYHTKIGFNKIYLIFDEMDNVNMSIAKSYPQVQVITYDSDWLSKRKDMKTYPKFGPTLNREVMSRQILNAEEAIGLAEKDGMDWIVHIDSDEMIYLPRKTSVQEVYQNIPDNVQNVHFYNYEVALTEQDAKNCFRDHTLFRTRNRSGFRAYYGTKSSCRVNEHNYPKGVHHFITDDPRGQAKILPESEMILLHYVNCNFKEWRDKYLNLGNFSNTWWGTRPIKIDFHKDSRDIIQRECKKDHCNEENLRKFYKARMLVENGDVDDLIGKNKLIRIPDVSQLLSNQCSS